MVLGDPCERGDSQVENYWLRVINSGVPCLLYGVFLEYSLWACSLSYSRMPLLLSLLVVGLLVFLFQVGGKVQAGMMGTYIRDSDTSQRIMASLGLRSKVHCTKPHCHLMSVNWRSGIPQFLPWYPLWYPWLIHTPTQRTRQVGATDALKHTHTLGPMLL